MAAVPPAGADDASSNSAPAADQLKDFPSPRSIKRTAFIRGKRIDYVATVGSIALSDERGKLLGEVVYTAYTIPGSAALARPVTFAVNGGPGAASVALNFGALGPKYLESGQVGETASRAPVLADNPNSWLPFTDLVFIDPIGTGYSRTRVGEAETKKAFMTADADVRYLSKVVWQWLSRNDRLQSPKYMVGESYGGYRVPRITYELQINGGIGFSGIVLVSPYLDAQALGDSDALSPLRHMINLPSLAASHIEEQGKALTPETMAPVERYAQTEFLTDYFAGASDVAATDRLSAKVADLIGLDPAFVRRMDGRLTPSQALRERYRDEGLAASGYDARIKALDPFPAKDVRDYFDPLLGASAPFSEAMTHFILSEVGWRVDGQYRAHNFKLYEDFDGDTRDTAVTDLRKAMANDTKLQVLVTHGWNDLSCPYFMSKLLIQQMPPRMAGDRLRLRVYPGGHMFYDRAESAAAWRDDAMTMFAAAGRQKPYVRPDAS
ncbi:S10 family peptidase [Sphingopyxis panaciterrae]